jgi:hypothetical protein
MRHYQRPDINGDLWDEAVWRLGGLPYFYSEFLDVVAPKWQALIHEDYSALFPIPVKSFLTMEYAVQPQLTQQLGLLGGNEKDRSYALHWLKESMRRTRICLPDVPTAMAQKYAFTHQTRKTYRIHFEEDTCHPWEIISKHHQRNILKFQKSGSHIAPISHVACIQFFEQNMGKKIHVNQKFYHLFLKLAQISNAPFQVSSWGVFQGLELIAVMSVLKSSGWHIYWVSASSTEGRKNSAAHGLVYHGLQQAFEARATWDFEGSMEPGLARFYSDFGAKAEEYTFIQGW